MSNCTGAQCTTAKETGKFREASEAIWKKCIDDSRLRRLNLGSEIRRTPVTQEFMVKSILQKRDGEVSPHPAQKHFERALYESIERMVGMLSSKYSFSCIDQELDLKQECLMRIWSKLDKFDPNKAKFTTWVWRVCTNVLNRQYRKSQRLREHVIHQPDEDIERKSSGCEHDAAMLASEYLQTIRELGEKFPKWKEFIYHLLGNPDTGFVPGDIVVKHAALKAGVGRGGAMKFYHSKIQPFMAKRFRK